MVNDLKRLLQDNVETSPAGDVDIAEVMRVGRQRRTRRHRTVVGVAAAAAVGAVVGGAALSTLDLDAGPDAADNPFRPAGPVISLQDARPAVEGTDYRVLDRRETANLRAAETDHYSGVTEDGLVLVTEGQGDPATSTRVTLVDPQTGDEQQLPVSPDLIGYPVALGTEQLVFRTGAQPGQSANALARDFSVLLFDRTAGTWTTLRWPGLPESSVFEGPVEHDGRLYLGVEDGDLQNSVTDLWSVAIDDTGDARDEDAKVGHIDITGNELTWIANPDRRDELIRVRDLATGDERAFDPKTADGCSVHQLDRVEDSLLLSQFCSDSQSVNNARVQVVTMDGEPVVTVEGEAYVASSGGSLAVLSEGHEPRGPFLLDPATGELWRVDTGQTALGRVAERPVPHGSDLAFWDTTAWSKAGDTGVPEPETDTYPVTQWLVEWLH